MDWGKVKDVISKSAPLLGSVLGPAGGAIGTLISAALGTENSADKVMEKLQGDPNAMLKMVELQNAHEEKLQAMLLEQEKADVEREKNRLLDVQNARDMNKNSPDNTARNLAYVVLVAFIVLLAGEFYVGVSKDLTIDDAVQRTLDISTGVLFAWCMAVKDFYFGSSHGEIASNKSLRRIAES
jgi:hypothetical protein